MKSSIHFKLKKMVRKSIKIRQKSVEGIFTVKLNRDKRGKLVRSVESGWSQKLSSLIWNENRLPCAWTFKRARVRVQHNDIHVPGRCKDCNANLTAFYDMTEHTIKVKITGFDKSIAHKAKRYMKGAVKADVMKMMEGNSAFAVQSKLADQTMNVGDSVPALVPNLSALRQLKARQMETKNKEPIYALKILKCGKFRGDIQEIGFDPFYVMFCTQLQSQWYNAEFNKKCPAILAIDATGIGLRKLDSCDRKSTLLYTLTARGKYSSYLSHPLSV